MKQLHADLVALGYEGSYNRVAAFARDWKAARHLEQKTTGRGVFVPLAFNRADLLPFAKRPQCAIMIIHKPVTNVLDIPSLCSCLHLSRAGGLAPQRRPVIAFVAERMQVMQSNTGWLTTHVNTKAEKLISPAALRLTEKILGSNSEELVEILHEFAFELDLSHIAIVCFATSRSSDVSLLTSVTTYSKPWQTSLRAGRCSIAPDAAREASVERLRTRSFDQTGQLSF
jgi:hypothetical protein